MEETSKIMPKWMEIKHKSCKKEDDFKSIEYYPIKQKCKKLMAYVDKDITPCCSTSTVAPATSR